MSGRLVAGQLTGARAVRRGVVAGAGRRGGVRTAGQRARTEARLFLFFVRGRVRRPARRISPLVWLALCTVHRVEVVRRGLPAARIAIEILKHFEICEDSSGRYERSVWRPV